MTKTPKEIIKFLKEQGLNFSAVLTKALKTELNL